MRNIYLRFGGDFLTRAPALLARRVFGANCLPLRDALVFFASVALASPLVRFFQARSGR